MFSRQIVKKGFSTCLTGLKANNCAIMGAQWGDEGKGKLVDILAKDYDICARFNGGANAGHTLVVEGVKYAFHLLPCGILYPTVINVVGNGTVVHLQTLFHELEQLDKQNIDYSGRLLLSDRAHLVTQTTIEMDSYNESKLGGKGLGTTKRGIGPTYAAKAFRDGLRIGDLRHWETFKQKYDHFSQHYAELFGIKVDQAKELAEFEQLAERLQKNDMIIDTVTYLHKARKDGKRILLEGANATMLDKDFGTYPYVTSSNTTIGGALTGLGLPPQSIETVIAIVKAYTTRVGEGPFPTELEDDVGKHLQEKGFEFGTTTGRPRRCGWLDLGVVKYAHMLNQFTSINITKLDVMSGLKEIRIGTDYYIDGQKIEGMPASIEDLAKVEVDFITVPGWKEDITTLNSYGELPQEAKNYLEKIEELTEVPVTWIGNGPGRENMFIKE